MTITLISQSGTMGITLYDQISNMNSVKIETLISVGNMAGLKFHNYIDYANKDKNTDIILIYMEDVKDGQAFIRSSLQCKKPIVVLKGGRSSAGAKAAASHTGALAGSDKVYQAAFKQAGVHLVDTIEEFIMAAKVFSMCEIPKGNKVGILSPGGGANISCSDFCEKYGLEIPTFHPFYQKMISKKLPLHAPKPKNPVDTAASFSLDDFTSIIYKMSFIDTIDILIINYVMTDGYISEWDNGDVGWSLEYPPKPIIGSWMGSEGNSKDKIEKYIPIFSEPAKAAYAASLLVKEKEFQEMKK